ncbi:MAG: IgGFc-binding protein, partial [Myxococcales bacterium]|nr:IgGFc-binding protein [Myxococcales bacterium]
MRIITTAVTSLLLSACSAGSDPAATGGSGAGGSAQNGGFVVPDGKSPACEEAAKLKTSVACDYYAVDLDAKFAADNGCFVAFVANTSNEPARISVSFDDEDVDLGQYAKIPQGSGKDLSYGDFDPGTGLAPGEVAILFLAGGYQPLDEGESSTDEPVPCPVPAAIPAGAQFHGTGYGRGFHITTSTPVVAYQMLPYGGGAAAVTGATLLIPTTAWDTDYVGMNAYGGDTTSEFGVGASMTLVASEDDTHITIVPKSIIGAGPGVTPVPAG